MGVSAVLVPLVGSVRDAVVMLLAITLSEAVVGMPVDFVVPRVSTVGVSLVVNDGNVDVKIME